MSYLLKVGDGGEGKTAKAVLRRLIEHIGQLVNGREVLVLYCDTGDSH